MKKCPDDNQDIACSTDPFKSLAHSKPAGFWIRVLAYTIDFCVFIPLLVLGIVNAYTIRNIFIAILIIFPLFFYKPFLESFYGATLGKMACGINVIDQSGNKLDLIHAYIRFIPFLLVLIIGLIESLILYSYPEFQNGLTIPEIAHLRRSGAIFSIKPIDNIATIFLIIDCIIIAFTKRKRALHDMMARSFCIYKQRG